VEEVVDTISVDSYRATDGRRVDLVRPVRVSSDGTEDVLLWASTYSTSISLSSRRKKGKAKREKKERT
jgi:hypothetical protein